MRKSKFTFIVLILFSISLKAQLPEEVRVAHLVVSFNDAIIQRDTVTLSKMVNTRLSYAHSSGLIQDKQEFLKAIMAGPNFFKSIERSGQTVSVSGKNATVRYIAVAQAVNNGNPVEIKYGCLMVWQKYRGNWKLLARQGYKI